MIVFLFSGREATEHSFGNEFPGFSIRHETFSMQKESRQRWAAGF